jgi:PPOX class probable F420-dependent enzyme
VRLTPAECRERLFAARHAVLATAGSDGRPHVVPVTFAVVPATGGGVEIVSAVDHKPKSTPHLRRLRTIEENPNVAVLAEEYDDDWSRLWWVRADGVARVVPAGSADDVGGAAAIDALVARYPQYADHRPQGPVIRVAVTRWTGWAAGGAAGG